MLFLVKFKPSIINSMLDKVLFLEISRFDKELKLFLATITHHSFPTKYAPSDIALLVKTDNSHCRLNAVATKRILVREFTVFGKVQYKKISQISVSHIYNLRQEQLYREKTKLFQKTKPRNVRKK